MPTSFAETRQPFTSLETLKTASVSTKGTDVDTIVTQTGSSFVDSVVTSPSLEPGVTSNLGISIPPIFTITMPTSLAEIGRPFTSLDTLKTSTVSTEGIDVDTTVTQTSSGSVDTVSTSSGLEPGVISTLGLSTSSKSTITISTSLAETGWPFISLETLKTSSVSTKGTDVDIAVTQTGSASTDSMATSSGLEPKVTSTLGPSGITTASSSTITMAANLAETRWLNTFLQTLKTSSVSTKGPDVDTIVTETFSGSAAIHIP
uniref:Mucin-22-like n=1 Tax=Phascolarctos cinereus TaxID=38626 RepID=A0A6P5J8J5_PHACI|nr:mucin-22-like [Phascolarctos cinereus]